LGNERARLSPSKEEIDYWDPENKYRLLDGYLCLVLIAMTMHKKANRFPIRYATIRRLEKIIWHNAARLFLDACCLYYNGCYSSAYALAILAHEEIGKLQALDHTAAEAVLNDGAFRLERDRLEEMFSRDRFYSHQNKQEWGMMGTLRGRMVEKLVSKRRLDQHKQEAFYVDFRHGRIKSPARFGPNHAYRHLRYVLHALEQVHDLPLIDLFRDSTFRTRKEADRLLTGLRKGFSCLITPRKLK
jgi:AbiV family abortive infection protein